MWQIILVKKNECRSIEIEIPHDVIGEMFEICKEEGGADLYIPEAVNKEQRIVVARFISSKS